MSAGMVIAMTKIAMAMMRIMAGTADMEQMESKRTCCIERRSS